MGRQWSKPKVIIEIVDGEEGKRCTGCKEWKPLNTGFNRDKKGLGERTAKCKECISEYKREYYRNNSERERRRTREWYLENRERASKRQKKYRKINKDAVAETNRRYRRANAERLREHARRYRKENREQIYQQQHRWYKNNKRTVKIRNTRRRSRESLVSNDLTIEQKKDIWNYFDNRCALTGSKDTSVDHVIPIVTGYGGTSKSNIIPLKTKLNLSKGPRNIFEWFEDVKDRFGLSEKKFNDLIEYLAEENGKSVEEYREYVFWCHDNPNER